MLIENLYQGRGIPENTKPEKVLGVMGVLERRLLDEYDRRYLWLAACTIAVEAGYWNGDRFRKRRLKLLALVNECRTYLELPLAEPPKGWEQRGLYYGSGAHTKYMQEHGVCLETSIFFGAALSGRLVPPEVQK